MLKSGLKLSFKASKPKPSSTVAAAPRPASGTSASALDIFASAATEDDADATASGVDQAAKRPRLATDASADSDTPAALPSVKSKPLSNIELLRASGSLNAPLTTAAPSTFAFDDDDSRTASRGAPGSNSTPVASSSASSDSVDAFMSSLSASLSARERADLAAAATIAALPDDQLRRARVTEAGGVSLGPVPPPPATGDASSTGASGTTTAAAPAASAGGDTGFLDDNDNELDEADVEAASAAHARTSRADAIAAAAQARKKDVPVFGEGAEQGWEPMPFVKNLYREHPDVAALTDDEVAALRKGRLNAVKLRGVRIPRPVSKWAHCGLPPRVDAVLAKEGFSAPFPIQAQTLPVIMSGRDAIACAKTGSGKTLAFVLPMIRHVLAQPPLERGDGPIAIVIVPIRELAVQITAEIRKFAKPVGLRAVAAYGGANISEQIAKVRAGAEIIVATPGRLIDLLSVNKGRTMNLRRVTYLVLDEADRMFDMGFEPQILRIVAGTRPDRQTLLFSATFPRSVETAARKILTQPIEVIIGGRSVASSDITQIIEVTPEEKKFTHLLKLLGEWYLRGNILIFVDTQPSVDSLFSLLASAGYPALAVHGGMDQTDRDGMISDFKAKVRTIMVATSVLARGLDVRDLVLVVNYDVPTHYEDYVHRIGRTGRAGAAGTAVTFITPSQESYSPDLVRGLEAASQPIPPALAALHKEFLEKVSRKEARLRANLGYKTTGFRYDSAEAQAAKDSQLLQRAARAETEGVMSEALEAVLERKEKDDEERGRAKAEAEAAAAAAAAANAAASAAATAASGPKMSDAGGAAGSTFTGTSAASASAAAAASAPAATPVAVGGGLAAALAAAAAAERAVHQQQVAAAGSSVLRIATSVAERFGSELEVNDYPEKARWALLRRQGHADILEDFNVAITAKGVFVEPGKKVPDGERKLYVLIEGKTEESVRRARVELQTRLETHVSNTKTDMPVIGGKYSI